jgi:UDP-glucose 4-epimerase
MGSGPKAVPMASPFRGLKVLITGGLGFIGSNLARRLLEEGADVILVDSLIPEYGGNLFNVAGIEKDVTINIADVRDEYSMRQLVRGRDVLFNLAGQTSHVDSMTDPYTDLEINCRAQLAILESCRQNNRDIRIVYASTRQIYGRPEHLPVDETHLLRPTDVNGINKMAGEWYHILYSNVHGIRASALRLTNTYGPRMRIKDARQTFLGVWIRNLLSGQDIDVYGDGAQLRDFNYVDDAVEAFLIAAASDKAVGEVFNLGAEPPINLRDLAALLVQLAGTGRYRIVPFPEERRAIDIGDYYADFGKAVARLGWRPRVALAEGLAKTLDFYRESGSHYVA